MAGKIKQRTSTSHKSQRRRQFQDEPREFENIVPLNAQPFHKPQPIIAQNEAQKRYINAIRAQTITSLRQGLLASVKRGWRAHSQRNN